MSIPSFSLEGKVALVTGGRRGIGKAIALAFAEAGADVAVCDSVVEDGELGAVAEEIQRLGRRSLAVQADVSRKTDVDNLVQKAMDEFGVIDILVNNAGIGDGAPLLGLDEDGWNRVIDVNLKGCHLCSQAVAKGMVERKKGNIISIASIAGIWGSHAPNSAYNISKAGVIMLTKVLSQKLGNYGIRVNAIAPGLVKTELTRLVWSDPERLKQWVAGIPLGRAAEPGEMAGIALFLASEASSYITGHAIVADGGQLA